MVQPALFGSGPAPPILNATAEDDESAFICVQGCVSFGMQVVYTGEPSALVVNLYGSNDGITIGTAPIASWDVDEPRASGDYVFAVDFPVQFVKAVMDTLTDGETVTVYLSGV